MTLRGKCGPIRAVFCCLEHPPLLYGCLFFCWFGWERGCAGEESYTLACTAIYNGREPGAGAEDPGLQGLSSGCDQAAGTALPGHAAGLGDTPASGWSWLRRKGKPTPTAYTPGDPVSPNIHTPGDVGPGQAPHWSPSAQGRWPQEAACGRTGPGAEPWMTGSGFLHTVTST